MAAQTKHTIDTIHSMPCGRKVWSGFVVQTGKVVSMC